jgi:hypothetical protein
LSPIPKICRTSETFLGAGQDNILAILSGFGFIPFCETTCQIPVNPRDVHKTAFVTKYGLYEYKTLHMGLCYGPPTCQRLNGLQWQI